MDFERLAEKAEKVVQERGGPGAVAHQAEELKDIAAGDGSLSAKAREAMGVLKEKPQGR